MKCDKGGKLDSNLQRCTRLNGSFQADNDASGTEAGQARGRYASAKLLFYILYRSHIVSGRLV